MSKTELAVTKKFSALAAMLAVIFAASILGASGTRASDTDGGLASIALHEDFVAGTAGSIFTQNVLGAGSNGGAQDEAEKGRPGIIRLRTGTTATGRGSIITGAASGVHFGGGEWTYEADVEVMGLSNPTQAFVIREGFIDSYTIAVPTDGAWIEYDDALSPNWLICTSNNGTQTRTASGVTVTSGWHRGKIVVSADASAVTYTMDGAALGTVTTDIPSNDGRSTGVGVFLSKTAGTINRDMRIGWIEVRVNLTTAR